MEAIAGRQTGRAQPPVLARRKQRVLEEPRRGLAGASEQAEGEEVAVDAPAERGFAGEGEVAGAGGTEEGIALCKADSTLGTRGVGHCEWTHEATAGQHGLAELARFGGEGPDRIGAAVQEEPGRRSLVDGGVAAVHATVGELERHLDVRVGRLFGCVWRVRLECQTMRHSFAPTALMKSVPYSSAHSMAASESATAASLIRSASAMALCIRSSVFHRSLAHAFP